MIYELKFKGHDEWLAIRHKYIGGSDAGAAVGLNNYKSPFALWAEKTGRTTPFEGNLATRSGAFLEDFVAQLFVEETGKKVRKKNRTLVNTDYPWACANVDRMVVGEDAILECKTTTSIPVMKKTSKGEFPDTWYCQVMHYMAVTGRAKAYIAALVNNREFHVWEVERDEAEIKALMKAEEDLFRYIQMDEEPDCDGSVSTEEAVKDMYPTGSGDAGEMPWLESIARSLQDAKRMKKDADALVRQYESEIKLDLGEHEKATSGVFTFTWKNQVRKSLDIDALKEDYPEIDFNDYYKESTSRVFRVKEAT